MIESGHEVRGVEITASARRPGVTETTRRKWSRRRPLADVMDRESGWSQAVCWIVGAACDQPDSRFTSRCSATRPFLAPPCRLRWLRASVLIPLPPAPPFPLTTEVVNW